MPITVNRMVQLLCLSFLSVNSLGQPSFDPMNYPYEFNVVTKTPYSDPLDFEGVEDTLISVKQVDQLLEEIFPKRRAIWEGSGFFDSCIQDFQKSKEDPQSDPKQRITAQLKDKMCEINLHKVSKYAWCASGIAHDTSGKNACSWNYYNSKWACSNNLLNEPKVKCDKGERFFFIILLIKN